MVVSDLPEVGNRTSRRRPALRFHSSMCTLTEARTRKMQLEDQAIYQSMSDMSEKLLNREYYILRMSRVH